MRKITVLLLALILLFSGCTTEQANPDPTPSTDTPSIVVPDKTDNDDIGEIPEDESPNPDALAVEAAYNDMISATEHLSITNDGYEFKGYPISKDSVSKIGGKLVVNQGAMYEEIAGGLALYCDFGLSQSLDETFFQILTGSGNEPENWNELANDLYVFILPNGTEKEIISKLETLDCVNGTFDYDARSYAFEIADLDAAVDKLHISAEMFGYVLARLNEYPSDIVFDGNSMTCSLTVKTYGQ